MGPGEWWSVALVVQLLVQESLAAALPLFPAAGGDYEPRKGCHLVGVSKTFDFRDDYGCEPLEVELNSCRGHCLSYTVPLRERSLDAGRSSAEDDSSDYRHPLTSISSCCRAVEEEMVEVVLQCRGGAKSLQIPSATRCQCFDCHHGR